MKIKILNKIFQKNPESPSEKSKNLVLIIFINQNRAPKVGERAKKEGRPQEGVDRPGSWEKFAPQQTEKGGRLLAQQHEKREIAAKQGACPAQALRTPKNLGMHTVKIPWPCHTLPPQSRWLCLLQNGPRRPCSRLMRWSAPPKGFAAAPGSG